MKLIMRSVAMAALLLGGTAVASNEVEGRIDAIDHDARTLTVQGIAFHTTDRTDYDDGLNSFDDLRVGQRVEVEFRYEDGRHVATEIELDD